LNARTLLQFASEKKLSASFLGFQLKVKFAQLKIKTMFNQVVGSGANAFLVIIAVLAGFVAGLSYVDFRRQKEKEESGENY
jgi:hypothetical protein